MPIVAPAVGAVADDRRDLAFARALHEHRRDAGTAAVGDAGPDDDPANADLRHVQGHPLEFEPGAPPNTADSAASLRLPSRCRSSR